MSGDGFLGDLADRVRISENRHLLAHIRRDTLRSSVISERDQRLVRNVLFQCDDGHAALCALFRVNLCVLCREIEISPVNPYIIPGFRQNLLIDCSCL